jgi:hypothetical protein
LFNDENIMNGPKQFIASVKGTSIEPSFQVAETKEAKRCSAKRR